MESINQAWIISNTSLLVQVGLAIFICYYVFTSLAHELESVRSEAAAVRAERTEVVKALVDQNAKISASIVEHAKSSISSSHAMEELFLNLAKARNGDTGNVAPQNKQAVPEAPINNSVAQ
jgi:nitrate reductase alpha subunit